MLRKSSHPNYFISSTICFSVLHCPGIIQIMTIEVVEPETYALDVYGLVRTLLFWHNS